MATALDISRFRHRDPPLRSRRVAIVGFASDDRHLVPWADPDLEIWGLNMALGWMPKWDRLFEMHDRGTIEAETAELKRDVDYLTALRAETTRPIYMLQEHADIACSVPYPIDEFKAYFGARCEKLARQPYATSTFGFMLGQAIMRLAPNGPAPDGSEIQVYGVPLLNDEEYAYQRENATFFAGFAMGRNIRLTLTENAAWMEADGLYGYTEPAIVTLLTRLKQMAALDEVEYGRKFDEALRENEALKSRAATLDGSRQYASKLQKRLTILLRGGKI